MNIMVSSSICIASSIYEGFGWICNTPPLFCRSWFCVMELSKVGSGPWGLSIERAFFCKALMPSATLLVRMLLKRDVTSVALLTYGISDCHLLEVKSLLTRIILDLVLGNTIFSSVIHQKEYYPPSADGNHCFTRGFIDSLESANNKK